MPRYSTFCAFCICSVYVQIRSTYSQYMNRFILHILSIRTDSFRIFSVYKQRNLVRRFTSFHVFSVYVQILSAYSQYIKQIHSAYSQYTYRFIPRIRKMRPNNLKYLELNYFILAFKGIPLFKKSMYGYVCNWTEDLQGIIDYMALAWQKNLFLRFLIIHEHFGAFKFIFQNNLGSYIEDHELAFDEKKCQKSRACVPLTPGCPDSSFFSIFLHPYVSSILLIPCVSNIRFFHVSIFLPIPSVSSIQYLYSWYTVGTVNILYWTMGRWTVWTLNHALGLGSGIYICRNRVRVLSQALTPFSPLDRQ